MASAKDGAGLVAPALRGEESSLGSARAASWASLCSTQWLAKELDEMA